MKITSDPRVDELFPVLFVLARLTQVTRLMAEKFGRPADDLTAAHSLAIVALMAAENEARPLIAAHGLTLSIGRPNSLSAATQAFSPEMAAADPDDLIKRIATVALAAADAAKAGA